MAEKTKFLEQMPGKTPEASSSSPKPTPSVSPSGFDLVAIQRTAGNMAMQRTAHEDGGADALVGSESALTFLSVSDSRAKMETGGINDPQEAEANRVAQMVMSGGTSTSCACGGTCVSCAGKEGVVRRKTEGGGASGVASAAAFGASEGRALDSTSRAFFEPHFGDLSQVRVHDGESAAAKATAIGARSYTAGSDIGFAPGEFAPSTSEGRKLIAHELAHVAQDSAIVRRQPTDEQQSMADRPVRGRVSRSDIASRGAPQADWYAQFQPQSHPVDPTDVPSIAWAQAWVKDLSDFELKEKRRFKIGSHLKSLIERLPPEVWLPSNDVISRSTEEDGSSLIVTGARGPIATDNLRNKLYTIYLSIDRPAELNKPSWDATGLIFDREIDEFLTTDEQAAADRFGLMPDLRPFQLSREAFTHREVEVLEFLFRDEMLEWRRRAVEVQESIEREEERRTGVFMAALGEGSIKAIGQVFKYSALAGTGMAAAPVVAGRIGASLGVESLASASWGTKLVVGTSTSAVIGGGTGGVDSAISNAPDLVRGDISFGEYLGDILSDAWTGAKWGAAFGAAGEVASPFLRRFWNLMRPASKVPAPSVAPHVAATPNVPTPQTARSIPGWLKARLRDVLLRTKLGLTEAAPATQGSRAVATEVLQSTRSTATAPTIVESAGASGRMGASPRIMLEIQEAERMGFIQPGTHQGASASAQTARSQTTAIRADLGETSAYNARLARGEIGLERPQGSNVTGPDYITAARDPDGTIWINVGDAKSRVSATSRFGQTKSSLPQTWRDAVDDALSANRLSLGNPALEQDIRVARQQGRVRIRQDNIDFSPSGQGQVTLDAR